VHQRNEERWDRVHNRRAERSRQRRPRGWPISGVIIGSAGVILGAILASLAGNRRDQPYQPIPDGTGAAPPPYQPPPQPNPPVTRQAGSQAIRRPDSRRTPHRPPVRAVCRPGKDKTRAHPRLGRLRSVCGVPDLTPPRGGEVGNPSDSTPPPKRKSQINVKTNSVLARGAWQSSAGGRLPVYGHRAVPPQPVWCSHRPQVARAGHFRRPMTYPPTLPTQNRVLSEAHIGYRTRMRLDCS